MLKRQTTSSCLCVFCKQVVSVDNQACPHCSRKNPSLWGYSRILRQLGADFGFTGIVTWGCIALYLVTLLIDLKGITNDGSLNILSPSQSSLLIFGAIGAIPVFQLGRWWTRKATSQAILSDSGGIEDW